MSELFVGVIIALPALSAAWVAWRIIFAEEREQRDRRIKNKGPIRRGAHFGITARGQRYLSAGILGTGLSVRQIMTEIVPGLGESFWRGRREK
jgi:hypothetical protein